MAQYELFKYSESRAECERVLPVFYSIPLT